jgi:hypothetical protein
MSSWYGQGLATVCLPPASPTPEQVATWIYPSLNSSHSQSSQSLGKGG